MDNLWTTGTRRRELSLLEQMLIGSHAETKARVSPLGQRAKASREGIMRHDDSSNKPRVNPAQNPRLAAVLGNVSLGLDDNPDSRNPHSQPGRVSKAPPLPPPLPPPRRTPLPAAPAPLPEELYLPDNNEIELLGDDASAGLEQAGMPLQPPGPEDEIEPVSGEFQLYEGANSPSPLAETPPPPSLETPRTSLRPGVIAYGTELPADPAPLLDNNDNSDNNAIELETIGEVIPSEFNGNSSELNASGLDLDEASGGSEQSPWSKAAPPILIDKRDLPSSALAAPEVPQKTQAPATPAESEEKTSAARSFVTLFLGIAVGACLVTFLLLYLGILHGPEGAPSSNSAPIVVPPPVKTADAPPAPAEPSAVAAEPSAAPTADEAQSAAPSESAAPSALTSADVPPVEEDPSQKSASPQTAASTPTAAGVNTAPVVQKPGGGTAPPPKKKTRIF